MKQQLCIDTIGDLDRGVARLMVNKEINRAVADLEDRGEEDGKVRKVTIDLELIKKDGLVVAHVACQAKLPPCRSNATVASVKINGGQTLAFFQELSPESPDQDSFPELDAKEQ